MSRKKHKQPPSEAQLAANRANALKSTGPKTPEGKARSSMNAWKHGLTASGAVLTHEYEEDFDRLALAYRTRYLPADRFELHLLDQIILVHWHMDRIRYVQSFHIEQEIYNPDVADSYPDLDPEIDTHALPAIAYRTVAETSRVLDITNRELARLSREYARLNQVFLDMPRTTSRPLRPPSSRWCRAPARPNPSPIGRRKPPPRPPPNSRCKTKPNPSPPAPSTPAASRQLPTQTKGGARGHPSPAHCPRRLTLQAPGPIPVHRGRGKNNPPRIFENRI